MPLQIIRQDITKMCVDAIVNTTNEEMIGYSGVDLAIHEAAGPKLDKACAKIAPLGLGCAKITKGYDLACKYIIHTSGPIWQGGLVGESIILRSCYLESLKLAVESGCKSIAFPLISSGVYGYPKDQVLKFAVQVITEFLFEHELTVYLCVFDRNSYTFSQKLFSDIQAFIDDDYVRESDELFLDEDEQEAECDQSFILQEESAWMDDDFADDWYEPADLHREATPAESPEQSAEFFAPMVGAAPITAVKKNSAPEGDAKRQSLQEYLKSMDKSFAEMLFMYIDERGMTDVECYKKANVDRKTFSKIRSNKSYKPSKQTAVAFAIALKLDLEETQNLLATAGLTLSRSYTFDKIIMYFILNEKYDIFEINEALFEFDQVLLGC